MFLVNKVETYDYAIFFKLIGDRIEGYLKNFFNLNVQKLYLGA